MKNKIQKYLSGEREGFSLVELIIVIAIMAILIGIIALAVIPYLEKSRVGKDQQTIDTVYSAFQATIAEKEIQTPLNFDLPLNTEAAPNSFEAKFLEAIGSGDKKGADICGKLASKDAKASGKITCSFDPGTNKIEVYATGTKGDGKTLIGSSNK